MNYCNGCVTVRSGVYDVKATEIGNATVRFKAEVGVDGRYLMKLHLKSLDPQKLLKVA